MLQGKIVIITGGAKGIGRYAAHTLAQAGGNVVIVDVDVERLHKTLGELRDLKFEAWALAADVRHEDEVRRMVHQVVDRYGQIDVLVNDAGIVPHFNWGIPRWPRVRFMFYIRCCHHTTTGNKILSFANQHTVHGSTVTPAF